MIWRNPVAWLGLATLLIPVLIHLLVRHRAEPRPFPSLRFVRPTRLASVRRKMISDWPLLLVRMAMLAAAVAALADPFWMTAARRAEWSERQARAIVVDTTPSVTSPTGAGGAGGASSVGGAGGAADASRSLVERETESAFRAETFGTKNVTDGIRRAAAWLRTAPPARRELVVISDFQLGALDPASLRDIPPYVGIRLVRTPGAPVTRTVDGQARTQNAAAGGFTLRNPRVTLNASETAVTWNDAASPPSSSSSPRIEIDASDDAATKTADITLRPFDLKLRGGAADRPFLLAAAEAVLAQGVPVAASASGVRHAATIIVADEATNYGLGAVIAPWQVDAARAIATDTALTRAVGRATAATSAARSANTATIGAPATASSAPSPSGSAASASAATRRAAETTASGSSTSESPSSEAAAKSRRASNAPSNVTAPWIVLMRDAGGAPVILAAAEGANANARMLLWSRIEAAGEASALLIRATLRALAGPDAFGEAEVIAIPDTTLAQWQRPASEPPASEWRDVEGNDRRWLWGAVLVLIVVEQVLRRRARHADAQTDRKVYEHAA